MTGLGDAAADAVASRILAALEQQDRQRAASQPLIQPAPPYTSKQAEQGKKIYEKGKFLQFCKQTFGKVWYGDAHILEGVCYTAAAMKIDNAYMGLHLHITGQTQIGKSDGANEALKFIHPNNRLTATFSMKWLYYAKDEIHPNIIIFSDDTTFDESTAEIFRGILTGWQKGCTRYVVINHKSEKMVIPPRVSLILTSVESVCKETDEGQDESRFLTLEVSRDPEKMRQIRKFIQENKPDISKQLSIIYSIWETIQPGEVNLNRMIERDIPIRDFKRYLTLVQSHALLCNRTTTTDADFAAIDTFLTYSKPMIDSTTPAFTPHEAAVRSCLSSVQRKDIQGIAIDTGMSIQKVYRAIHGARGTFQNPKGGLMLKESKLMHESYRTKEGREVHEFWLR